MIGSKGMASPMKPLYPTTVVAMNSEFKMASSVASMAAWKRGEMAALGIIRELVPIPPFHPKAMVPVPAPMLTSSPIVTGWIFHWIYFPDFWIAIRNHSTIIVMG
jgi:hypothetical protein